jgi:transcriptional regulator with XRE-family HTH domain
VISEVPIHETPGDRVKMLRIKAGLTQAELGRRVVRSQGWVSQVERGDIELDKVSVVNELARELHCHPREITSTPGVGEDAERGREAATELVRRLRRLDLPPEIEGHRPLPQLEAELAKLGGLRGLAHYTKLGEDAVDVIVHLHAATTAAQASEREAAYHLLVRACKEVHSFAYGLGYSNLVELATARARWCAERSDDPLLPAIGDYMAARDAWTTADWGDAMILVDRALATVDAAGANVEDTASLTGALQLRAAITAARANDADEAYGRLDAAEDAAGRMRLDRYGNWFNAGNVALHGVAVAVELGDGVEAVRRAKGLIVPTDVPASRVAHHHLDTARGYVWVGEVERGLAALERADRAAPQLVRNHPMAQATVRSLLRAERRSTRERLRRMATRLHVE